jgi:hypothetical protein
VKVERSVVVPAGAKQAYDVIADVAGRPRWLSELRRVEAPPGAAFEGGRFVGQSSLLFHDFLGVSEVIRADPGRTLAEEVYLGARFTSEWTLETVDGGTCIRHVVDVDFPAGPLGRIERFVLRRRLASMQRASLQALADSLQD